jgi:hypothetical protein
MALLTAPILARKWVNTQAEAKIEAAAVMAEAKVEAVKEERRHVASTDT